MCVIKQHFSLPRRLRSPAQSRHVSPPRRLVQRGLISAVPAGHGVRRAGGARAQRHPLAVRGRRRHVPVHRAR